MSSTRHTKRFLPSARAIRAATGTALSLVTVGGLLFIVDPPRPSTPTAGRTIVQTRVVTTERTIHLPAPVESGDEGQDRSGFEAGEDD